MTTNAPTPTSIATGTPGLRWSTVLAVVAHPDDDVFGVGGVLDALVRAGAEVSVLCLTRGKGTSVDGPLGELAVRRSAELKAASELLSLSAVVQRDYVDSALSAVPPSRLAHEVIEVVRQSCADGILIFDPLCVADESDGAAVASGALRAAETLDLPVVAWSTPVCAAKRHGAPDEAGRLRWLREKNEAGVPTQVQRHEVRPPLMTSTLRVDHRAGDQFAVNIRGHRVIVDQPIEVGGNDEGPTPTELFVAGLATCVAFYARRYLRRHRIDTTGLSVDTSFDLATGPSRVASIDLRIRVPQRLEQTRREGMLEYATHCAVANSFTLAPEIAINLS